MTIDCFSAHMTAKSLSSALFNVDDTDLSVLDRYIDVKYTSAPGRKKAYTLLHSPLQNIQKMFVCFSFIEISQLWWVTCKIKKSDRIK